MLIVDEIIHSLLIFFPKKRKRKKKIEALKSHFMYMLISFNTCMAVSGLICVHVSKCKILGNVTCKVVIWVLSFIKIWT